MQHEIQCSVPCVTCPPHQLYFELHFHWLLHVNYGRIVVSKTGQVCVDMMGDTRDIVLMWRSEDHFVTSVTSFHHGFRGSNSGLTRLAR